MHKTTSTRLPAARPPLAPTALLQRKCACGNHTAGAKCGACGRQAAPAPSGVQIGAHDDPLEHEADRIAALAMAGAAPAAPGRGGAAQVRRMPQGGGGPGREEAPASVARVLAGAGQPLAAPVLHDMQRRFSHDFSAVRVHTGARAAQSARDVSAEAYTLGHHVVFGEGRFAPGTAAGRRLLAHELAHVVQGAGVRGPLRRKVSVDKPKNKIANPTGTGLVQTNGETIQDYLRTLCPGGGVSVDKASGKVALAAGFCPTPLPKNVAGPVAPAPAHAVKEVAGCGCVCDMVRSATDYLIVVDDADWPHTSGTTVTAPSPNSTKLWGTATASGKATVIDPWLVLGHELCGHAWLADQGLPDENATRGEGGHQETVGRENEIRAEHGIEARGDFKAPFCGESFFQEKAGPGPIQWSSFLEKCRAWRQKTYKGKYKISDRIP